MLNDDELRVFSQHIRQEAKDVLSQTKVEPVLKSYGASHLIGSYAYDVMLKRDIDFHVVVPALEPALAKKFFDWAVDAQAFEYVLFHDKHTFNAQAALRYPTNIALDSYSFGLRLAYKGNEWQIGVNFITQPQAVSEEIVGMMADITEEQRRQVLRFKYELQQRNFNVSSSFIYRAVIERHAHTWAELTSYLRSLGYRITDAA